MEISDIRVKLIQDASDRLKAVCSITLDDEFVVRDLKVVEGTNGLFVAMPSRKLSVHCPQCRGKNHLRARFCNECGAKLPPARATGDAAGRLRMHRDIAHPINPTFREIVQSRVIEKYRAEAELSKNPDYVPVDIDADFEEKVQEISEDTGSQYAPSEYDQLIAGLNKGAGAQPAREREPRPIPAAPSPRPPRTNDRRHGDDRPPRPQRGPAQRSSQKPDTRRSEPARPPRNHGSQPRIAPLPPIYSDEPDSAMDEVNGNVAPPAESRRESSPRRPSPPRRGEDRPPPRRTQERSPERNPRPMPVEPVKDEVPPRRVEPIHDVVASRPVEPPAAPRPTPAPPKPAPPAPTRKYEKAEDLPFGAGL